jgi:hypothetical protein
LKNYISILAGLIVLFLVMLSPLNKFLHPKIWLIFAFFASLDFMITTISNLGLGNNREKFIQFFLTTVVLKFILILIFIAVMMYLDKENKYLLVWNVFGFYLFFTIFEISTLLRKLRRF